jgi:phospholipase C
MTIGNVRTKHGDENDFASREGGAYFSLPAVERSSPPAAPWHDDDGRLKPAPPRCADSCDVVFNSSAPKLLALLLTSFLAAQAQGGITQINHVVIIVKQNRSFDHYFGTFPGADGATTGTLSTGQVVPLVHASDKMPDLCNSPACNIAAIDGGKMDRYDTLYPGNKNGDLAAYSQMHEADIPNYFSYARHFVLGDRMFSPQQAAGFPNQLIYVAANTGGAHDNPFPKTSYPVHWGCDSNPIEKVQVFDNRGNVTAVFPCFDFPTMADSLDKAGLTWKYYGPLASEPGYEWSSFAAISHIRNTKLWNNDVHYTEFAKDALSGNLPTVSWLISPSDGSEHPGTLPFGASTCDGENWTVQQIDAIMQGPLWKSTAIFVTWDDNGGFYDHVAPPVTGPYTLGVRLPLLVISPFAKAGYISHVQRTTASFLKFIETRFHLPALTDLDAGADDMLDSFDFTQAPRPPLILQQRACPLVSIASAKFGSRLVGSNGQSQSFLIENKRNVPLKIATIIASGPFSQTNTCPASLAPGLICQIDVSFTPPAVGAFTGQLTVIDNDASSPQVVELAGTGSHIQVSPGVLDFGRYTPIGGPSGALTATVTNQGSATVGITRIETVGDFTHSSDCNGSLPPGSSCSITVRFVPSSSGERFGSLFVTHTDWGSPSQVLLLGYGKQAIYTPANQALTFGPQALGTVSAPQLVTVTNRGTTVLTFASIVPAGDFTQTNNCGIGIAAGASCTIQVRFNPSQKGTRTGQITVTDNDLRGPQFINLTGTGQ